MADWWAVRMQIPMLCDDGALALSTWLYSVHEPWSVYVDFGGGNQWEISRDLLLARTDGVVGLRDVQVWQLDRHVALRLSNRDKAVVLKAPAADVDLFLERSLAVVAAGEESTHVDLDAVVAKLLAGRPGC